MFQHHLHTVPRPDIYGHVFEHNNNKNMFIFSVQLKKNKKNNNTFVVYVTSSLQKRIGDRLNPGQQKAL